MSFKRRTCFEAVRNGPSRSSKVVPFGLDWRCCGSEERNPKLIIRVIIFELVQPICPGYLNVTDGQMDGRTTHESNTALALRRAVKKTGDTKGKSRWGNVLKCC